MYKTNLDYFLLSFGSQSVNSQTVLSPAPAPQSLLLPRLLAGLHIYSQDISLLHSRLLQLKECLCLIQLTSIIQHLKALLCKDSVSILYTSTTLKSKGASFEVSSNACVARASSLFLPPINRVGFPTARFL